MKHLSSIVLSAVFTCLMFSAVLYSSCSKTKIDKCETVVCKNGGTCTDGLCKCPTGYEGANCETKTDLCKNVNCLNGGKCFAGNCSCPTNFAGKYCEIDLCKDIICNNGKCHLGKCVCDTGYEGKFCDTMVREKFIGSWHGESTCSGTDLVTVSVDPLSDATETVLDYSSPTLDFTIGMKVVNGYLSSGAPQIINGKNINCNLSYYPGANTSSLSITITDLQSNIPRQCYVDLAR